MKMTGKTGRAAWARLALVAIGGMAAAAMLVACGGGGSSNKTATPKSDATRSATSSASKPGTPGANGTSASGSPAASGTNASGGTPSADNGTPGPSDTPGATPNDTPVVVPTNVDGSPVDEATVAGGQEGHDPVTSAEATLAADSDPSVAGGDPTKPQQTIGDVPDTPDGASIDGKTLADPNPGVNDTRVILDLDATKPGIQATRDVKVGDVIRVGVVVTNSQEVSALGFEVDYDKAKLLAPTIINGPSTDRNPDLNVPGLGGASVLWVCSPSPAGDKDDSGAGNGDGDPSTGQAWLNCYTPLLGHQIGTIVLATIEFHVLAAGTSTLTLNNLLLADSTGTQFARCEGDPGDSETVPCVGAQINAN